MPLTAVFAHFYQCKIPAEDPSIRWENYIFNPSAPLTWLVTFVSHFVSNINIDICITLLVTHVHNMHTAVNIHARTVTSHQVDGQDLASVVLSSLASAAFRLGFTTCNVQARSAVLQQGSKCPPTHSHVKHLSQSFLTDVTHKIDASIIRCWPKAVNPLSLGTSVSLLRPLVSLFHKTKAHSAVGSYPPTTLGPAKSTHPLLPLATS